MLLKLPEVSRVLTETLVDFVGRIRSVSYNFLRMITKGLPLVINSHSFMPVGYPM